MTCKYRVLYIYDFLHFCIYKCILPEEYSLSNSEFMTSDDNFLLSMPVPVSCNVVLGTCLCFVDL